MLRLGSGRPELVTPSGEIHRTFRTVTSRGGSHCPGDPRGAFDAFRIATALSERLGLPLWLVGLPERAPPKPDAWKARRRRRRLSGLGLMDEGDEE